MCNMYNMVSSRTGCNFCGCGCDWLNTLFGGRTQTVCRDCCGNLQVRNYGCNTWNQCGGCNHGCHCGCHFGNNDTVSNNTSGNANGTVNNGNGYVCVTRCGQFNPVAQTTGTATTSSCNGYGYQTRCGCNRCGGYYNNY